MRRRLSRLTFTWRSAMSPSSENEWGFIYRQMSVRERHKRERQARSDAILAAALRVFGEHGLEHSTIEMIAREAEVAVGTIYLYFSSRDDLFLNLLVARVEQLRHRYLDIQASELAPLKELREVAAAYLDHIREWREMFLTQQSAGWT